MIKSALVIAALIIVITVILMARNMERIVLNKKKNINKKRSITKSQYRWIMAYRRLSNFFLTERSLMKLHKKIRSLSVYSQSEDVIVTAKLYVKSRVMLIVVLIASYIVFKDLYKIFMACFLAILVMHRVIDKELDDLKYKMLLQAKILVSQLGNEFAHLQSVGDALAVVVPGPLLARDVSYIQEMLVSDEANEMLEEYYQRSEIKPMQTLAAICLMVDDGGDTILDNGTSNFANALSFINEEINFEIRRFSYQKALFGSLENVPFIPLAMCPIFVFIMQGFVLPGLESLYEGLFGFITDLIIIASVLLAFKVITTVNSANVIKYDDRSPHMLKLLRDKRVREFATTLTPTEEKGKKKKLLLDRALSRMDMKYLYLKKYMYALIAFTVALSSLAIGTSVAKDYYEHMTVSMEMSSNEYTEEQQRELQELDAEYLKNPNYSEEELLKRYKSVTKDEGDAQEELERFMYKQQKYENTYFKFWYVFLALLVAMMAFVGPEMELWFRAKLIEAETEEDCLQMQTVISILMNSPINTMFLLDWLSRQSKVFHSILVDAFHEYAHNPYIAINRLRDKSRSAEFRDICSKLEKSIDKISLSDAFYDLVQERSHLMKMREVSQLNQLEDKRSLVSPIANMPMNIVFFTKLLVPVGVYLWTISVDIFSKL